MNEPQIKDIMTRQVIVLGEDEPLALAVDQLAIQRISCVVVVRQEKPVGVITERDIVSIFNAAVPLTEPVKTLEFKEPVCVQEGESILESATIMEAKNLRRLMVVDRTGRLRGIVTQSDIIQSLGPYYSLCFRDVSSVISHDVVALAKECDVGTAVREMAMRGVSCVVALEEQRPVGIFTERDVVRLLRKGGDWRGLSVNEVMSWPVITVSRDTNLMDAIRSFRENGIRRLPIVDGAGFYEGVVTQTGIIRNLKLDYVKSLKRIISRQSEVIDESEKKYQTLVESAQVGIIIINSGAIRFVNPMFQRMLGVPEHQIIGGSLLTFVTSDEQPRIAEAIEGILSGEHREIATEVTLLDAHHDTIFVETNLVPIRYEGKPALLATLKDITQRKQQEAEIRRLIITDELTGIYNHRHFINELDREIDKANRYHGTFSLLFADIDNFKEFNDLYGHLEGDKLLRKIAQLITKEIRTSDAAFRYGGEEYTVLMPSTTIGQAMVMGERLCRRISETPFEVNHKREQQVVFKSVSIGLAEFTVGDDTNHIISKADHAMYVAKKRGKKRVEYYRPE